MNKDADSGELFTSKEENMIPSQSDFRGSSNICQAAEDSVVIRSENFESNAETTVTEIKTEDEQNADDKVKYSDDLFPSDPSTEEFSLPSSSHSAELSDNISTSESHSTPEISESPPSSDELDEMSLLNRIPDCSLPLPKLEPTANHSIMFSPHIRPGDAPRPYPPFYKDVWDSDHVRMPCSPLNRYPVENMLGEKRIESRWDLICRSLSRDIGSSNELEEAIMKYNTQYKGRWNFEGLHAFINKHLNEAERDHFFETILPAMIELALNLPNICTRPVPMLKTGKDHYVTMSQKQIGCLLCNAFFCTFPRRSGPHKRSKERWYFEYANYPDINFNRLFYGVKGKVVLRNAEKLKCLLNYFRRITTKESCGTVTFHRQCIPNAKVPVWRTSTRGIRTAVVRSSGLIETDGKGMLQVDFANKYIGGGVLGQGCVQEEIRFVICPELIVSRLFVERLDNNESLIITGVEQYSKYSGYADTFKWEGDFRDETPRDSWGRRCTQLLAIDAIPFKNRTDQFKIECLNRELRKAYCGFYEDNPPAHLPAIATGNWGCGAFRGNPNLKFLIQLMAASEAGRSLVYFTFGNKKLKAEMQEMYEFLNDRNLAIGDIWRLLMGYVDNTSVSKIKEGNLYEFIYSQFVIKENFTQEDDASIRDQFINDCDKKTMNKMFEDIAFGGSSTEIEDGS